jgi:hypothetical protein
MSNKEYSECFDSQCGPMHRYLISRKSSIPYLEPSRPLLDAFTPPKGATSVEIIQVLHDEIRRKEM